jgi:hypothetical protein
MKKLILGVFAVFFAITSYAQGIDFGIKAGANFSTLTDATGLNNKTGFHGGIFLGLKFNDKIALQPELLYSQQGAEFDMGKIDLNYINVPVIIKYYLVQGLNIQVGPQFGFVVDDNISNAIFEAEDFDVSGVIGAGYDFPFGIRLDARYNFGFTDVVKDTGSKNGVFSIALGYSFL